MTASTSTGGGRSAPRRRGRPPGPTVDRAQRRRELLAAAERAIRARGPRASMDEIAAEAGITKPILYDHFGDKAGLAAALTEQVAEVIRERLTGALRRDLAPRQRTYEGIDAFLQFVEAEPQLYGFLAHSVGSDNRSDRQRQLVVALAGEISGQIREALEAVGGDGSKAEPWGYAIIGQIVVVAEWWLATGAAGREQLAVDLTDLVWGGLSGRGLPAD